MSFTHILLSVKKSNVSTGHADPVRCCIFVTVTGLRWEEGTTGPDTEWHHSWVNVSMRHEEILKWIITKEDKYNIQNIRDHTCKLSLINWFNLFKGVSHKLNLDIISWRKNWWYLPYMYITHTGLLVNTDYTIPFIEILPTIGGFGEHHIAL